MLGSLEPSQVGGLGVVIPGGMPGGNLAIMAAMAIIMHLARHGSGWAPSAKIKETGHEENGGHEGAVGKKKNKRKWS